jgi:hypothetical protein
MLSKPHIVLHRVNRSKRRNSAESALNRYGLRTNLLRLLLRRDIREICTLVWLQEGKVAVYLEARYSFAHLALAMVLGLHSRTGEIRQ